MSICMDDIILFSTLPLRDYLVWEILEFSLKSCLPQFFYF